MGFGKDFLWGVAASAYQIEGGACEDGKGLSIWDTFCKEEGKIKNGQSGDVACDHYHRFEEDVRLMAELGIKMYRFSLSWTRILPNGIGGVNQKGIEFYDNLIDTLLKYNITPMLTLFHWDYPEALEKRGSWLNPDSPKWFAEYARVVAQAFGDKAKYFMTFNEPQSFLNNGYYNVGNFAPGRINSYKDAVLMAHNVMLAHGLAVKEIRAIVKDSVVGYAPTCGVSIPASDDIKDIEAARKCYFNVGENCIWSVSWWSDPVVLGRYPEESEAFQELKQYLPQNYKEDLKIINQPLDFYGQNIYTGSKVKDDGNGGYKKVQHSINAATAASEWLTVMPESLYWGPKFLYERYKLPIFITENGMSDLDTVFLDGKVHDLHRIDYLHRYLREYKKAGQNGVEIIGYCLWSFMDNFEWTDGYSKRFGIVYVDFETQQRIPKDSFYWYKKIIETNGETI